ncbi:MAG TPA: WXG100 family type VII secretion target [Nonomuraea sp.]|nr:WXG100 family type VII secretion target [Nonomuraea sp.]
MTDAQVVTIVSAAAAPQGGWPQKEADEIKRLLQNTDSFAIQGAGQTYMDAASKIEQAVNALEDHAAKIAGIWKGPDAAKAQHALRMLHASGNELRSKLSMMGGALQAYAGHLNDAKTKANEAVAVTGAGQMTKSEVEATRESLEKVRAQRALYDLNQQIVSIYTIDVPRDVSYELPTVNLTGGPPETRDPNYPTGPTTSGPTFGGPLSDGGGYDGGPGGPGSSGTPDGSGGSGSDGTGSVGSDPGSPGTPDPDAPTPPVPGQPQNPGPGDGTVPPVIGDQDRTSTDGANPADPRQTDMASFQPTTATLTPSTVLPTTPPVTTINPSGYTFPTPVGGTPGIPAVIGSPGVGGGQPSMLGPGVGRGVGAPGGTPFMPFMGGGAGAGEYGDLERNTYVPEDSSSWTTSHETTDPVIG